jgi:hypothetical protein
MYAYTGNLFTVCSFGSCPANYTSDYLIATISFAGPLAPNLPLTDLTASLTGWTLKDALGYFSFSSKDPNTANYLTGFPSAGAPPLALSTDSQGNILNWDMFALPDEVLGKTGVAEAGLINPTAIVPCGASSTCVLADFVEINFGLPNEWDALSSVPGKWSQVPEPSALLLASLSAAVLIMARRRKRQDSV